MVSTKHTLILANIQFKGLARTIHATNQGLHRRKVDGFFILRIGCSWHWQLRQTTTCQLHPKEKHSLQGWPGSRDEGSRNSGPGKSLGLSATIAFKRVLRTSPGGVFLGLLSVTSSFLRLIRRGCTSFSAVWVPFNIESLARIVQSW